MVTASHNDMADRREDGANRPLTFGRTRWRSSRTSCSTRASMRAAAALSFRGEFPARYIADLTTGRSSSATSKLSAPAATAPRRVLRRACLSRRLRGHPARLRARPYLPALQSNTEDMKMLHAMADAVRAHQGRRSLGFDGDGDRGGVVATRARKSSPTSRRDAGARHLCPAEGRDLRRRREIHRPFMTTRCSRRTAPRPTTGRPAILHEARVNEIGAVAGSRSPRHFFFNQPIGRGYDDGLVFALAVCDMPIATRQKHGGSQNGAAQDLVVADDVAALRRRDK